MKTLFLLLFLHFPFHFTFFSDKTILIYPIFTSSYLFLFCPWKTLLLPLFLIFSLPFPYFPDKTIFFYQYFYFTSFSFFPNKTIFRYPYFYIFPFIFLFPRQNNLPLPLFFTFSLSFSFLPRENNILFPHFYSFPFFFLSSHTKQIFLPYFFTFFHFSSVLPPPPSSLYRPPSRCQHKRREGDTVWSMPHTYSCHLFLNLSRVRSRWRAATEVNILTVKKARTSPNSLDPLECWQYVRGERRAGCRAVYLSPPQAGGEGGGGRIALVVQWPRDTHSWVFFLRVFLSRSCNTRDLA